MENGAARQPVPTTCAICEELFPSRTAYLAPHKTCRMTFPCGQCDEVFDPKGALKEHMKAHRVSFTCDLCETEPFGGQGALADHKFVEHGVRIECPCGKSFARVDARTRHMKECTKAGPSLRCECGLALRRVDDFKEHQEACILSQPGAAKAVKRRFDEIEGNNRARAMIQALEEVAVKANAEMPRTCFGCGASFSNVKSMGRHRRKFGH